MFQYLVKQAVASLVVLFVVVSVTFLLVGAAPGGLGVLADPNMDPEVRANIERAYGLDQPLYVQYLRWMGNVMLFEAALSFLGLGILPPTPSWGNMLTASQNYVFNAPHLAVYPGLMILFSVLVFNSLGDVIRDTLDPRMRVGK